VPSTSDKPSGALRIFLVAAEPSGDQLGAALMEAINARVADVAYSGIGGPRMTAAGMASLHPLEKLSVMGLVEVLPHLPELLRIRRDLARRLRAQPPDLFIGIDAPDFNLGLARQARAAGIRTVQYVSPTVWAWKQGRVKVLRSTLDLVLSIFPFEEQFLRQHGVPSIYVGHPLADQAPLDPDPAAARDALGLPQQAPLLALLPGSRVSEVRRLSRPFLEAAVLLRRELPALRVAVPLVNRGVHELFEQQLRQWAPGLDCLLLEKQAELAIEAADVVLTASGTATLQTLLYKKPMVVGYRVNALSYRLVKLLRSIKVEYIAMANLLAGEELAPEFLQQRCTAANIAPALLRFMREPQRVAQIRRRYRDIHVQLRRDAADRAAAAVLQLAARCDDD
jgi:lipid-A-disaccharide synthase